MVLLVLVCHTTNINVWICAVVSDNYAVTVTSESYTLMGFLILQGKKYLQNNTSVIHKHIFLVFFSGLQPLFENVKEKWIPEIIHHCLKTLCLLETKLISEMGYPLLSRNFSKTQNRLIPQTAEMPFCDLKPVKYIAFTQKNLNGAFDKALLTASETVKLKKSHRWVLLRTYLQSSFCIIGGVIRIKAIFKSN